MFIIAASAFLPAGCGGPLRFPVQSLPAAAAAEGAARAFDTNKDGKADFFIYAREDGRFDRIRYDHHGYGAADEIVKLDAIPFKQCRHLVIIVDGFGYDLVKKHYDAGNLRFFHPPSRVVAPYPVMTDMAVEDILGYMPCPAYEAMYYDRRRGKIVGGSLAYLAGKNEPYNRLINYRAGLNSVPYFYLMPRTVFPNELSALKRVWDKGQTQEVLAYFGSTAGMGTRYGAAGQIECLEAFERLMNQIVFETHGMTKITLLADHGHGYEPVTRIDFSKPLAEKGWRLTKSIKRPKDVAMVEFGLTTYASFYTPQKAELAKDLAAIEGVTLASYAEKDTVVVLAPRNARAIVREKAGRYSYEAASGDPLQLKTILAKLKADANGYYDADELLQATDTHIYPAPLQRIYRAHFGLVENPADVLVSLEDRFCVGSKLFATFVKAASTHGSLNYKSSVAFIMSTTGPLPPLMRSADVPEEMRRLLGAPWPMGK